VPRRNAKLDDGKCDLVELEEWVKGMKKTFTVVEVLKEKKVNIGMYYLTSEADVSWNTIKG